MEEDRNGLLILPPDDAHVWLLRVDSVPADLLSRWENLLSPPELARAGRFRFPDDRSLFVLARAQLRQTLSRYAPIPPASWIFATTPHGRPHIAEPSEHIGLYFSVSHTPGLVAVAVSRLPSIGVDVENTSHPQDLDDLAAHALSASEKAALHDAPQPEHARRFFELWTLKEAFAKATGLGLALPFHQLSFHVQRNHATLHAAPPPSHPGPETHPGPWSFHLERPTPTHQLALAVRRQRGADTVRWTPIPPQSIT